MQAAGGLITSTLLSLFYVPVVFTYVDDLKRWVKGVVARMHRPSVAASAISEMTAKYQ